MSILAKKDNWIKEFDLLSERHYTVIPDFLIGEEIDRFLEIFRKLREEDAFKAAGIGTLDKYKVAKSIRSDKIFWLDRGVEAFTDEVVFSRIDELISLLNKLCFLSISGCEFHYAHYPPGSFYLKHLDQFNNRNNRLISVIMYLNKDWKKSDGGQLRLFLDSGEELDIDPEAGKMVLFRSNLIEHEVLPTLRDRFSITGWLLNQPPGLGFL